MRGGGRESTEVACQETRILAPPLPQVSCGACPNPSPLLGTHLCILPFETPERPSSLSHREIKCEGGRGEAFPHLQP